MNKIINWGIIGCGDVTEVKSGPAFNKTGNAKLFGVMRRDKAKAVDYAKRHHVPTVFDTADELIHSDKIDAVYIATPPSTHKQYAIAAMKAGKPVYVEKPMASTYNDCLEMNQIAEQTGIPLFVAYYRRTLPGFLIVKDLLNNNTIGNILLVQIRLTRPALEAEKENSWRVNKNIAGGGIFYDLASHQFDYLDFLFGPVTEASGLDTNNNSWYEAEDTVSAIFKFKNGVIGSGLWSFNTNKAASKDQIEIIGTEGSIIFSCFDHSPIQLLKNDKITEFPYLNPENIQYNLIKQVNDAIINKDKCVSTGESAARTNWVMEHILRR